jgi:hypothetical protein
MLVSVQLVGLAATPLKVTVLVPGAAPKFVPLIVTGPPIGPIVVDNAEIVGGCVTVNITPLLNCPPTDTVTGPLVTPDGTVAMMLVGVQLVEEAEVPLNEIVLVPGVAPKFVPLIVTGLPTPLAAGDSEEIVGGGITVNVAALLLCASTMSRTGPVTAFAGTVKVALVSLQLVANTVAPLKSTMLVPCV